LLLNPLITVGTTVCPPLGCALCLVPAASGYVAAYIGDRYGPSRAPAIWPIVASYVATAVALVALVVGYYALIGGTLSFNAGQGDDATQFLFLFGAAVVAGGMSTVGIPLSYALSSEEKHVGDDGSALPGWFEPGHPKGPKYIRPPRNNLDTPPPLEAMAY
jgi:MFS family permease